MLASALLQGKALDMRGAVLSCYGHGLSSSAAAFASNSSAHVCPKSLFQRQFRDLDSLGSKERRSRRDSGLEDHFRGCRLARVSAIHTRASGSSGGLRTSESSTTQITFSSLSNSGFQGGEKSWTVATEEPAVPERFAFTPLQQDTGVFFLVLVGAYIWVRVFDFFTSRRIFGQKLSRKIVHITSGLLYMLCWPFFSSSPSAPFIAGLVPLANGIRLLAYGTGTLKDEGLVRSMSRSGDPRELLRGPLYYVLVLYTSTVVFWRQSPVGMIALAMMCAGDGIADIMGRKFGTKKLPYNPDKSWAGSIAMFVFGFLASFGCMQYFSALGFYQLDNSNAAIRLAVISLAATIVESLPITAKLDDNFTVPATVFVLGMLSFPR
ncbi:hypothetical protein R1flu_024847 [Riccia fluitans]|uniref:phytol kinase n=1 Tax=Riccia fluitans TaxID=41844 RepID=A0ABD1XW30_9MARC